MQRAVGTRLGVAALLATAVAAPLHAQGGVAAADSGREQAGEVRVDVGGYGAFRYQLNSSGDLNDSFTLRRFVVTTDARLSGFQAYAEVEFERLTEIELEQGVERTSGGLRFEHGVEGSNGSELALEQAWGQFNVSPVFGIRFGAVLPPVGRFNMAHDDNLWNFPVRPLIDRAAQVLPAPAAWTEMGLGIVGTKAVGRRGELSYQAYVLNGVELGFSVEEAARTRGATPGELALEVAVEPRAGAVDGSNAADAFAARVQYSPRLGSQVAVSAYTGSYVPDFVEARGRISTLALDGRQKLGPFYLEGEGIYTRYSNVAGVAAAFARVAVNDEATSTTGPLATSVEVELTNLAERRYGFWADLSRPIALGRGVLGLTDAVVIPAVRYERAWLSGLRSEVEFTNGALEEPGATEDVSQDRVQVGVAFRPVPPVVVHLFYQRDHALSGALISPSSTAHTNHALVAGLALGF